jgi:hypothetical protein
MATEYASQATDGAGSTLEVGDGASPEIFTAIAEITTITPRRQASVQFSGGVQRTDALLGT